MAECIENIFFCFKRNFQQTNPVKVAETELETYAVDVPEDIDKVLKFN